MLDQSVGLFEDVTYDDMIKFVKDKITAITTGARIKIANSIM